MIEKKRREREQEKRKIIQDYPNLQQPRPKEQQPSPKNEKETRKAAMAKAIGKLHQQARKDVAEIEQKMREHEKDFSEWETHRREILQMPADQNRGLLLLDLMKWRTELEADTKCIGTLTNAKKADFERRRQSLLEQYPEATIPSWRSYFEPLVRSGLIQE